MEFFSMLDMFINVNIIPEFDCSWSQFAQKLFVLSTFASLLKLALSELFLLNSPILVLLLLSLNLILLGKYIILYAFGVLSGTWHTEVITLFCNNCLKRKKNTK